MFTLAACDNGNAPADNTPPPPTSTPEATPTPTTLPETTPPQELNATENGDNEEPISFTPKSEWTLFINGEETDVYVITIEEDGDIYRLIPIEVALLLGGTDLEYFDLGGGDSGVAMNVHGMSHSWDFNDDLPIRLGRALDRDGTAYVYFLSFTHPLNVFHRTDTVNKSLFLEETETPWTLYIDNTQTAFAVIDTNDLSRHDALNYWGDDFGKSMLESLYIPFMDMFRHIGAEFVLNPQPGGPNYHDIVWNGEVIWGFWDPDNPHPYDIQTTVLILQGFGFSHTFDIVNRNLFLSTP